MMLHEHEQGRLHVQTMTVNLEEASKGEQAALEQFSQSASLYVQLLRAHIRKEDGVLFPLAGKILSENDQGRLKTAFHNVEKEDIGKGVHEHYLEIARNLANRYGVSSEAIPTASCGCGH
jgi:hemerythrin-like domain-containing protein